jgi:hypothetical protein
MIDLKQLDYGNYQSVSGHGNHIRVLLPLQGMTVGEALVHAAWIVALADHEEQFDEILSRVRGL